MEAMLCDLTVEGEGLASEEMESNFCSLFCLTNSRSASVPPVAVVVSCLTLGRMPGPGKAQIKASSFLVVTTQCMIATCFSHEAAGSSTVLLIDE